MDTPPPASAPPPALASGNDKIWAILSHLSFFIGVGILLPLVVYLAMRRESAYASENARQALNFHLSLLIYVVCCVPLVFLVIGIPLLVILVIGSFVLAIVAAVKASEGGCYHYPLSLPLVK